MEGIKCEHPPCTCYVDIGETYCSARCRIVEDVDEAPHGHCSCNHTECEGTSSPPA